MTGRGQLLADIERDLISDKPLADVLRMCVLLGGQVGSVPLREWASKELKGYAPGDDLPDYRRVGAGIFVDATTINARITGQQVSTTALPDVAREHIHEYVEFRDGVGAIEALMEQAGGDLGGSSVKLLLPGAAELTSIMNHEIAEPFQHITSVYWQVSRASLKGIVDQVRTALTELVAELRAGTPRNEDLPSQEVANQAVNVTVRGIGQRINVGATDWGRRPGPRGQQCRAGWFRNRLLDMAEEARGRCGRSRHHCRGRDRRNPPARTLRVGDRRQSRHVCTIW